MLKPEGSAAGAQGDEGNDRGRLKIGCPLETLEHLD